MTVSRVTVKTDRYEIPVKDVLAWLQGQAVDSPYLELPSVVSVTFDQQSQKLVIITETPY